jgi:DnaJ-class molecular chaperone
MNTPTSNNQGTGQMNPGDEAPAGTPGTGEDLCPECSGKGQLGDGKECPNCGGTGKIIEGVGGG